MTETKCVFCEIVKGSAPTHIVHEDEHSLAILDINPYAKGHCLVISKSHVPWWHELGEAESESVFRTARLVAGKMMKALQPDFVCMYARGRRIPHTHIFLIPTFGGDVLDRFFNALENFQESPRELAKLAGDDSLRAAAELIRSA
jgi:histidine triad (HIT) family protein